MNFKLLEITIISLRACTIAAAATTFALAGFAMAPVDHMMQMMMDQMQQHEQMAAPSAGK